MMINIPLPFGKQQLNFEVNEENLVGVLGPHAVPACHDLTTEIRQAMDNPLGTLPIEQIVKRGEKVLILVDDYTRDTPVKLILPLVLERLAACAVRDQDITLLVSTGTHRPCSEVELRDKLGDAIYGRFQVEQHDCSDPHSQVFLGLTSRATPVWVHHLVVESNRLFGIGHIDPSDYAGYAGGYKLIVPGVAALETVDANHSLAALSFRRYGSIDLPCRQDIDEAGSMVRVDQFINVVLCQDGQIARVFAGAPAQIHPAGVAMAKQVYEVDCPGAVDIAVVSAYPYDVDFYQAMRAIEYADVIVRPGGSILVAAPCPDGMGNQDFYRLLSEPGQKPDDFLRNIARRNGKVTYNVLGYFLAQIRAEKRLYGYLPGVPALELESIGIHKIDALQAGVNFLLQEYGLQARLAVLPVGSATIPHLVNQ
ncbi:MAG: nickel-dependent lactate racemase [Anaerolineaceae bacterium]|nr:nickel-dependent lactate racemase [Anaerolineaceae bacterium]